jgi:hypothetical protein
VEKNIDIFSVGIGIKGADLRISSFRLFEVFPLELKTVFSDYNGDMLDANVTWDWYGPHEFDILGDKENTNEASVIGIIDNTESDCLYNVV